MKPYAQGGLTEVCGQLKNILHPKPSVEPCKRCFLEWLAAKIPWCIPGSFYLYAGAWKQRTAAKDPQLVDSSHRIFLLPLSYYCLPSSGELQHKNHCFFPKMNHPKWLVAALESNQFSSYCPSFITSFITPKTTKNCEKVDRKDRSKNRLPRPQLSWVEFTKQGPPPTTVSSSRLVGHVASHGLFPLDPNVGVKKTRRVEKMGIYHIYNLGGFGAGW